MMMCTLLRSPAFAGKLNLCTTQPYPTPPIPIPVSSGEFSYHWHISSFIHFLNINFIYRLWKRCCRSQATPQSPWNHLCCLKRRGRERLWFSWPSCPHVFLHECAAYHFVESYKLLVPMHHICMYSNLLTFNNWCILKASFLKVSTSRTRGTPMACLPAFLWRSKFWRTRIRAREWGKHDVTRSFSFYGNGYGD